jgi:hypothetical protein
MQMKPRPIKLYRPGMTHMPSIQRSKLGTKQQPDTFD